MINTRQPLALRVIMFGSFLMLNAFVFTNNASAVAFLNDPVQGVPFRPDLWNIVTVNGQRTLNYAFAPAGEQLPVLPVPNPPRNSVVFQPGDRVLVNQAVATWNNPGLGANNNVTQNVQGAPDLRTWATHELGHALGLSDPNVPGTINGNTNFSPDQNPNQPGAQVNPFVAFAPVDGTTLRQSQVFANRATAAAAPYNIPSPPPTEAVMIQGLRNRENRIALGFDDVHGLQALQSGPDFRAGTQDDFTYRLNLVNFTPDDANGNAGQQINLYNANLRGRGTAVTDPIINRATFPEARIYFGLDEFGNVLSESDVFFTPHVVSLSDDFFGIINLDSLQPELVKLEAGTTILEIGHVDVFFNVPEPGTMALLGIGMATVMATRRRKHHSRMV